MNKKEEVRKEVNKIEKEESKMKKFEKERSVANFFQKIANYLDCPLIVCTNQNREVISGVLEREIGKRCIVVDSIENCINVWMKDENDVLSVIWFDL